MDGGEADVGRAAASFHDDVPHSFQVSIAMSNHTRDLLAEIRDEVNDRAGEAVLNTNDVVQLALLGSAAYHETATGQPDSAAVDEQLRPLFRVLHDVVENDEQFDYGRTVDREG